MSEWPSPVWLVSNWSLMDWSIFHAINAGVATRDWLEDPVSELSGIAVTCYGVAIFGLWFPPDRTATRDGSSRRRRGLVAAAIAMLTNQVISHLWDRPRPFTAHAAATHLLSAPSPDPSFPSDHAAVAFAIAFAVLAFSRRGGVVFLAAATGSASRGSHSVCTIRATCWPEWRSAGRRPFRDDVRTPVDRTARRSGEQDLGSSRQAGVGSDIRPSVCPRLTRLRQRSGMSHERLRRRQDARRRRFLRVRDRRSGEFVDVLRGKPVGPCRADDRVSIRPRRDNRVVNHLGTGDVYRRVVLGASGPTTVTRSSR